MEMHDVDKAATSSASAEGTATDLAHPYAAERRAVDYDHSAEVQSVTHSFGRPSQLQADEYLKAYVEPQGKTQPDHVVPSLAAQDRELAPKVTVPSPPPLFDEAEHADEANGKRTSILADVHLHQKLKEMAVFVNTYKQKLDEEETAERRR